MCPLGLYFTYILMISLISTGVTGVISTGVIDVAECVSALNEEGLNVAGQKRLDEVAEYEFEEAGHVVW